LYQGYKPPDEGPSEYQTIPLNKIEDFGVHCKQYVLVPVIIGTLYKFRVTRLEASIKKQPKQMILEKRVIISYLK